MKKLLLLLPVLALMIITISCGRGGSTSDGGSSLVSITVGGEGQSAEIKIEKNAFLAQAGFFLRDALEPDSAMAQIPSNIVTILFTISGPDMTTIYREVSVAGQSSITETFLVPNGINRHFLVEAKNASGNIIYRGETIVNTNGNPLSLAIDMHPRLNVDVNTGSDTPNCGDVKNPCKTITFALTQTTGNEEIFIAAGTYNAASGEEFPLLLRPGTFLHCAAHTTTIDGATSEGSTIIGDIGARIQGCTVIGDPAIDDNGQAITVNVCVIDGNGFFMFAGIALSANSSVTNSTVRNFSNDGVGRGIAVTGGSPSITNNVIVNNDAGVRVSGGTPTLSANTISNNATGIYMFDSSPNITGNTITGNLDAGIDIASFKIPSSPSITNNTITNNGTGISVSTPATPSDPSISNNILSCNTNTDLSHGQTGVLNAPNNRWDHIPPTVGIPSGCISGEDICIVFGGTVNSAGGTLAPSPCP